MVVEKRLEDAHNVGVTGVEPSLLSNEIGGFEGNGHCVLSCASHDHQKRSAITLQFPTGLYGTGEMDRPLQHVSARESEHGTIRTHPRRGRGLHRVRRHVPGTAESELLPIQ